jgi:hypothetical protein
MGIRWDGHHRQGIGARLREQDARAARRRAWILLFLALGLPSFCVARWWMTRGPAVGFRPDDVVSPDGQFAAFDRHEIGRMSIDDDGMVRVYVPRVGTHELGEPVWGAYEWPTVSMRWIGPRTLEVAHDFDRDQQCRMPAGSIIVDDECVTVVRWICDHELDDLRWLAPLEPVQ